MHPSKLPILINQVLYHAEFWYLITVSYTRRVDLIQLGTGGSDTDAQKLLGGRTGGAEAWCNHAAG